MKRVIQLYQQLPKAIKDAFGICVGIVLAIVVGKLVGSIVVFIGEWIYRVCKAVVLFVFPNMSHDAKLIALVVGLFSIPLFVIFLRDLLSKKIGQTRKKSV